MVPKLVVQSVVFLTIVDGKRCINLTLVHEWMTVYDAKLLLHDYYMKVRSHKKYGGWKTVETLMNIASVIFKETLRKTYVLNLIKSKL